ncbi:MAG: hypothetical protein D4S02_16645, partial [Rhodocyclaceae bacterium]
MNQIVTFDFASKNVRVVLGKDGEPWFLAADICASLELPETHKAVVRLDVDETDPTSIPTPVG